MVLTVCLLAACSHDADVPKETVEPGTPEQQPIGFSADLAETTTRSSRAVTRDGETYGNGGGELDDAALRASGFGVFCWYTGSADFTTAPAATTMLMRNQKVEWNGSRWTYTPAKYWPLVDSEKLTFRAYAPYVNYNLQTDADTGLPLLPVVVKDDDYRKNCQHDPLWGTGRLVDPSSNEYYPEPDPEDADQSKSKRYGEHYDNITYEMSGDYRLANPSETRNGVIDWYFHHGMAKIMFWGLLADTSSDAEVNITSIKVEHLYDQGLLDTDSPVKTSSDKPRWSACSGDMTVTLYGYNSEWTTSTALDENQDLSAYTIGKENTSEPNDGWTLLTENGLLIIPRDFSDTKMKITVTFYSPINGREIAMSTEIDQNLQGNTVYTFQMTVSNSALTIRISEVYAAFKQWNKFEGDHDVYNW